MSVKSLAREVRIQSMDIVVLLVTHPEMQQKQINPILPARKSIADFPKESAISPERD